MLLNTPSSTISAATNPWDRTTAYHQWIASLGLPIHRGYYIEDLRTIEVGPWEERQCNAAIVEMTGQEGVSEIRITEIPPAKTTSPSRMALDELVYVVEGRGLTTISAPGRPGKSFEWQKHSLFLIPRNHYAQFSNTHGENAARLLHYNSLPLAMQLHPDPDLFFNHEVKDPNHTYAIDTEQFYSEAKVVLQPNTRDSARSAFWQGNFFPDMRAWDNLIQYERRGAGGQVVWIRYPSAPLWNHMSVFPSRTYKKGHRHGPGTLVVIPAGEGYSYIWPEGKEKVLIPWHEASGFVPPNRWFHQHFNVSSAPDRYLAFHSPRGTGDARNENERIEDRARDQIEYTAEDPLIRKTFEDELAKRGLTSLMPDQAYHDPNYRWSYRDK